MKSDPMCSVVVCTHNRPAELERCLQGISRITYSNFEVVVVDNSPDDDRTKALAADWNARYVLEPQRGLSRARNRGVLASRGDIVAFIDDDAVPQPEWLGALAAPFRDPNVMGAAGSVVRLTRLKDGRTSEQVVPDRISKLKPFKIDRNKSYWFEAAHFGGVGNGSNMAFRRSAFQVWNGFEVRLGRGMPLAGGEENYAFAQLIELGFAVAFTPDALVFHYGDAASAAEFREQFRSRVADAVGYMLFVFLRSKHKLRVIRFACEALCGKRQDWHRSAPDPALSPVSIQALPQALLKGPFRCLRSYMQPKPIKDARTPLLRAGLNAPWD